MNSQKDDLDWTKHPRYREIVDYFSKGEVPPKEVEREARLEISADFYYRAAKEGMKINLERIEKERIREMERESTKKLREIKEKYKSKEDLRDEVSRLDSLVVPMVVAWIVLLLGSFFLWDFLWYVFAVYTTIGLIPFLYLLSRSAHLGAVLEEWKAEEFQEFQYEKVTQQASEFDAKEYLRSLTPKEFEKVVARILEENGYQTRTTSYVGDFGADVIAKREGKTFVGQVKQYSEDNVVGRPELQKLQGSMLHYDAEGLIFVTLGYFSTSAKRYAQKHDIILIDGPKLYEMAMRVKGILV